MQLKRGFERLRGVAAAGAMGIGALAGGSVRAASIATTLNKTVYYSSGSSSRHVMWLGIGNSSSPFGTTSPVVTSYSTSYSGGGSPAFVLRDALLGSSSTSTTRSNAFDTALILAVNGTLFVNPGGVVDLTGNTVTSGTVTNIVSGLDASVEYYFAPDRAVVRALYSLTNTTGADIPANVLVAGNYGSNANTVVQNDQSGDAIVDATDRWFVTDDSPALAVPVVTTTRYGANASVVPGRAFKTGVAGEDNYGMRYAMTVPANSTRRVMVFHELGQSAAANATAATDFESFTALETAGLLSGLTGTQQAEIVNYGNNAPTFDATPTINGSAAVGNTLSVLNTATTDLDGDSVTLSYQWLRDSVSIGSATASTYAIQSDDAGSDLSVTVTAADGHGGITSVTTAAVTVSNNAPTFDATPSISGNATVGDTLSVANTATTDIDGNSVTLSYQWLRDSVAIGSATASTYTVQSDDAGSDVSVTVTADDGHGGTTSVTTAAVTISSSGGGGGGVLGLPGLLGGLGLLALFRRRRNGRGNG